jgi:hypothetical protein
LGIATLVVLVVYGILQLYQMKLWQLETKAAKAKVLG